MNVQTARPRYTVEPAPHPALPVAGADLLFQMIWKVPEMIGYLSGLFTLAPGDLIFSGTPAGVGRVKRGDMLKGHIDGIGDIEVRVV